MTPLISMRKTAVAVAISQSILMPLHAATIEVSGTCSLSDAILSANNDAFTAGCSASYVSGSFGDDTITLTNSISVTDAVDVAGNSFPTVESTVTIEGNNHTVSRDPAGTSGRLFNVSSNSANLTINQLTINGGSIATSGGAMYIDTGATVTINDSTLSNNTAVRVGGAISVNEAKLTLNNSSLTNNSASGTSDPFGAGGAIYAYGGEITINAGVFDGNEARRGGALSSDLSEVSIIGASFSNNVASTKAGAIELLNATTATTVQNSVFISNTAATNGGAIDARGDLNIIGGEFSSNRSGGGHGGAVFAYGSSLTAQNVEFTSNRSNRERGGAIASEQGDVTIDLCTFTGNFSGDGGALSVVDSSESGKTLILRDSELTANGAFGRFGGGAGVFSRGVNLLVEETQFSRHRARRGGAILFDGGDTRSLNLTEVSVISNTATFNGGGINVASTPSVNITSSTVQANIAGNNYSGDGGGVHINSSVVTISDSVIQANQSNEFGGGIYVKADSTVNLDKTTITANSSTLGGGGLFGKALTNLISFDGATVSENTSSMSGGGIYIQNGSLNLLNTTVSGNTAAMSAGILQSAGIFDMRVSTISGNQAASQSGVSLMAVSNAKIYASTIFGNNAGGLTNPNSMVVNNTIIANNTGGDCDLGLDNLDTLNNWFGDETCSTSAQGDPNLGPLANNNNDLSGNTMTHLPLTGSGVIRAGNALFCSGDLAFDQRGARRKSVCDIGAVEVPDETSFFVVPLKNGKSVIFDL